MWPDEPDGFVPAVKHPGDVEDGWIFPVVDGEVLVMHEHGAIRPLTLDEFRWVEATRGDEHYLGRYRGTDVFVVDCDDLGPLPQGVQPANLFTLLGRMEQSLFYLAGRAVQIAAWDEAHQFCGRCGTAMEHHENDRAKVCPDCGLVNYPRLSPSIIVLVRRDDEMLLARNVNWPEGMFSTLAGFVEPGESVEQALHREVEEEVGVQVNNLVYKGSQSWPFPNSLMLGYHADYAGGEFRFADGEIAEAHWFKADEPPRIPPPTSISRWLIDAFIEEVTGRPADNVDNWRT